MHGMPPGMEVYPVPHLPIVKAYADQRGLGGIMKPFVPTEMEVEAGTMVLGLVLETLSGRSPLYRLEELFAHQDTERRLGKAFPSPAFTDDTVGRVLERRYDMGTMKRFTACAGRAAAKFGLERRYGHFDTTSRSVWGEYQFAEDQAPPLRVTDGYRKDNCPDLQQCVRSTLWVDRAVPMWGKPEDGTASDKTRNATLLSEIAQLLARYGVQRGAYIYIADAALVTEENLAALGETLCLTRLPATYSECDRVSAEAVAPNRWEAVGVLAQPKPTKPRPAASYKAADNVVPLYGKAYRAVVVHSSTQAPRRQKPLARELQASYATLEATVPAAAKQAYFWRADAEAAAGKLRALPSASYPERGPGGRTSPVWPWPSTPSTATPRASAALWAAAHPPRTVRSDRPPAPRGRRFCPPDACAHARREGAQCQGGAGGLQNATRGGTELRRFEGPAYREQFVPEAARAD